MTPTRHLLWFLLPLLSIAAPVAIPSLPEDATPAHLLDTRAADVAATCTPTPVASPAPVLHCGATGTLKHPKPLASQPQPTGASTLQYCVETCFGTSGCVSVGFDTSQDLCTLYGGTLDGMGLVVSNNTIEYYNKRCYSTKCPPPIVTNGYFTTGEFAPSWVPTVEYGDVGEDYGSIAVVNIGAPHNYVAQFSLTQDPSEEINNTQILLVQNVTAPAGVHYQISFDYQRVIPAESTSNAEGVLQVYLANANSSMDGNYYLFEYIIFENDGEDSHGHQANKWAHATFNTYGVTNTTAVQVELQTFVDNSGETFTLLIDNVTMTPIERRAGDE